MTVLYLPVCPPQPLHRVHQPSNLLPSGSHQFTSRVSHWVSVLCAHLFCSLNSTCKGKHMVCVSTFSLQQPQYHLWCRLAVITESTTNDDMKRCDSLICLSPMAVIPGDLLPWFFVCRKTESYKMKLCSN